MPELNQKTKAKILSAAETVFHENGFKGARTTKIAERAKVSRTMLHYYYSTKEELFHEVLLNSFGFFIQHAQKLFEGEPELRDLIDRLIDLLSAALGEKPGLATFVVNILNSSPEIITGLQIVKDEQLPRLFDELLDKAREKGEIQSDIDGENLLLNIYGMLAMPYLGAPLIQFKENRDQVGMQTFLKDRKDTIKSFVWNGLKH